MEQVLLDLSRQPLGVAICIYLSEQYYLVALLDLNTYPSAFD
jgi:hypothetical protein